MSRVSITVQDHVAHVQLTRGDKMNAQDSEMMEAIVAAAKEVGAREDVRAVVLSGEGKAFSAGIDLASFAKFAGQDPSELLEPRTHGNSNIFQAVCMAWRQLPIPVIAAIQGAAYGAGFQLALGADIRIAGPQAKFAVMEMKWGIIPDMGGMAIMPKIMRDDVIRKMTYTADPIDVEQALAWGIVTETAEDPLAAAMALASKIANKGPNAIRAAKRAIDAAFVLSEEDALLMESREQARLMGQPEQMEVVAAQMQGRAPKF